MFLLPSILLGLVFAVVLGGRPSRILDVPFRRPSLVVAALLLQVVLYSRLGAHWPDATHSTVHLASYVLLIVFAAANVRLRTFAPVLLGMVLNTVAIAANEGYMPVSPEAAHAAGIDSFAHSNVSQSANHLRFLGDIFALPDRFPLGNVFSVGDILIGLGMAAFIVAAAMRDGSEPTLSLARLIEPVRVPTYRRLVSAKLVSHLGDWLTLAALIGWLYGRTGSTRDVAALLLVRLAPPIIGGGLATIVVDRLPKGRLLMWIELARGCIVAVALVGLASDIRLAVFGALACSGFLAAVSNAATGALVPSLLDSRLLPPANAGLALAKDVAMAVGAMGAGIALSSVGAASALAADLGTFAVASLLLRGLRMTGTATVRRGDRRPAGALRMLLGSRSLLLVMLSFAAATIATGLVNATLPRLLREHSGLGVGGYGYGIAALAVGLALGEMVVGLSRVGHEAGRWIGAGLLLMSGLFVFLAFAEHGPTILLVLGGIGFIDGTTDVVYNTVIQREADPRYLGSAFGFSSALMTTTMMGAVALSPVANGLLPSRSVILTAGVFLLLGGALALAGMAARRRAADLGERALLQGLAES
ncbi:MAG: MFS transporter [Actinobacteria bacterium]|nr:MAG: MFS transporter [Actinomycetota bacterium]